MDRAPPLTLLLSCEHVVVTVVLRLRSSPTHAMEALRHEHERDLVEVKGIAVWDLNVLVDATRHHGETETADQKQRLGGPSLKEREGKGSEWRSASGRRQLQTRTQDHGFLPTPPPPRETVTWRPSPPPHPGDRRALTREFARGGKGKLPSCHAFPLHLQNAPPPPVSKWAASDGKRPTPRHPLHPTPLCTHASPTTPVRAAKA